VVTNHLLTINKWGNKMQKSFNKHRTCILILGMHRSGTSAVAGCFSALGYNMGNQLFPPDKPNEKGYFENVLINQFNDSLLSTLYARWHDTLFLPQNWYLNEQVQKRKPELISILKSEFGEKEDFVIKDPRISVLLPFYEEVFNDLNIIPKVIINFRNPFEVSKSLKKRDNLSSSKSLLLWMDATLKAEEHSRTMSRVFLEYGSLLKDVINTLKTISDILRLDIKFDQDKESVLNSFVEKKLNHHTPDNKNVDSNNINLVIQLFKILQRIDLKPITAKNESDIIDINKLFYSAFRFYNGIDDENDVVLKVVTGNTVTSLTEHDTTGKNKIDFLVNSINSVSEFILYPASRRMVLQFYDVTLTTRTGQIIKVNITSSNAEKILNNRTLLFGTDFPWIKFVLHKEVAISKISFYYQILAYDNYIYRASIDYIEETISYNNELLKVLRQKNDINVEKIKQKWNNETAALKTQLKKAKSEATSLNEQLDQSFSETTILKNEIVKLKTQIAELDKQNAVIQVKNSYLEDESHKLVSENKQLTGQNIKLLSTFNKSLDELKSTHAKQLDELKNTYAKQLDELKSTYATLIDEKDKLILNYKNNLSALDQKNNLADKKIKLMNIELAETKRKYEVIIENLNSKYSKLSKEMNLLKNTIEELTTSNSWKIGRALTWPVRKPKEKLRDRE
jgi:hypothetical protein